MDGGGVKCWGVNGEGFVGDGTMKNRDAPVDVIGLPGPATAISGGVAPCAVVDGVPYCWTFNQYAANGKPFGGFGPRPPGKVYGF